MLERIRNQITELRKEEERRYTYEAEFSFSKELPVQYSEWMNTIWDISNRDKIKIYLVSEGGESFDLKENVEEEYAEFLKGLESDETVEVSLTIDKKIVNGYLSVYCFEKFAEDISSLPIDKVLTAFSNFMKKAGRSITFELFDSRDMFYTKTMFFLTAGSRPLDLDFDRTNRLLECRENAYFYNQDNGCIYWAISELYKKGIDNIDAFNISSMLSSNKAVQKTIEKYNLPSIQEYIDLCSETARHTLEEYKLLAQTVVTLSYKRDMIKSISEIQRFCQDKTISLGELSKKKNDVLSKLDEKYIVSEDIKLLGDEAQDLWQEICDRRTDSGIYGIPSMFPILSNWFTYEPTELVVIQAKYKQGKSVLLMLEALHKVQNGIPTLYVDREMSDRIFYERCLASLTGVDVKRIKNGKYSAEEGEACLLYTSPSPRD